MQPIPTSNPPTVPATRDDVFDLSELINGIRRRFWLLVVPAVLGGTVALVLVLRQVPLYRATAAVRLGAARAAVMSGIETPTTDPERCVNPLLSYMQLFRSRTLVGEVVDSVGFLLRPDYRRFRAGLLETVRV